MINLQTIKKAHFIGIGGIGVSAIARMFIPRSFSEEGLGSKSSSEGGSVQVSGSDRSPSPITAGLEQLGVKIFYEQKAENITADLDLVVYTIAIPKDHPELARARELGITCLSYPEVLGLISADKFTIAVAGTHGKTTTTAMIAEMMIAADLDPTVIVGSLMMPMHPEDSPLGAAQGESLGHTNFIAGRSDYLVVEACEYRRSFLNINPKIIVITNIDADHLDYYKDLNEIQNAFAEFAGRLPADGYLICDSSDLLLQPAIASAEKNGAKVIDYRQIKIDDLALQVPGAHNLKNAQVALAVGEILKVDQTKMFEALNDFKGTWRRFEFKGQTKTGALVYDDYAHHPTEIVATIQGARELMVKNNLTGRLLVAFQPHLYSRTKLLKTDFATALSLADQIFLLPIYAAREPLDPEISSEILAAAIKLKNPKVKVLSGLTEAPKSLVAQTGPGDLVLVMGAGDVVTVSERLVEFRT
ncbi:MAG: UDP-N-acetylmuramate--L-alanine ligase [Candidatus Vogelbacteria bacterium CG10_big_fil_rev_8_21_14_0_10_49_38]|uniref:UDP-N-acetylmuramate--L-alanine ligase n=1 Tax=Candidatus Vogelbacteria bacterium CG10_big_fil_rev_8_21_14_0_10_49_38 TaxID=1975043 RepID=A0A2H0RHU4_9BACT|nr:MAG: UDP-N-acetylmuramate--L-alanine ligase [bacterium CG10_49_38]PIR46121.1 MAG: UDP-N-acetylmuramate--L-alanine ligase [Candidatus Vogelbacteria bacterium CG10_big_fil_rev_8_21_14_0_10_49_38]